MPGRKIVVWGNWSARTLSSNCQQKEYTTILLNQTVTIATIRTTKHTPLLWSCGKEKNCCSWLFWMWEGSCGKHQLPWLLRQTSTESHNQCDKRLPITGDGRVWKREREREEGGREARGMQDKKSDGLTHVEKTTNINMCTVKEWRLIVRQITGRMLFPTWLAQIYVIRGSQATSSQPSKKGWVYGAKGDTQTHYYKLAKCVVDKNKPG